MDAALASDGLGAVRALLRAAVAAERAREDGPGAELTRVLWDEVGRLADGGKHLRARLLLHLHDALRRSGPTAGSGRDDPPGRDDDASGRAAVRVAGAVEMLHASFLLHDDLIDGGTTRRGRPNLLALARDDALARGLDDARAHRWGEVACLLAGDLALGLAHHLVATADVAPDVHGHLQRLLQRTVGTTVHGELGDVALELGLLEPDEAVVLEVARAKTAMYSFRAPAVAAGLLAGADEVALATLDRVGCLLGEAFQLVDDVRGALAAADVTGKTASDLDGAKATLVVLEARRAPGWAEVAACWGTPAAADGRLRDFLVRSGAVEAVCDRVESTLVTAAREAGELPRAAAVVLGAVADEVRRLLAECTASAVGPPSDKRDTRA